MTEFAAATCDSIRFTSWRCKRCHKVNRPSTLVCSCAPPEPSEDQIGQGYTKPPESWDAPS